MVQIVPRCTGPRRLLRRGMRFKLFMLLASAAVIAAGCGSRDELGAESFSLSCGPNLDRYPVLGPHNGGYDANWN